MATPVIPRNDNELEEMFNDKATLTEVAASRTSLLDFVKAYAGQFNKATNGDLDAQIEAAVQDGLIKYIAAQGSTDAKGDAKRLDLRPASSTKHARIADKYNPNAPGAKLDAMFPDVRDFMKAIWHGTRSSDAVAAQHQIKEIMNSFGSNVPADGGFLIPEYLRSELLRVALEKAVVRPRARVVPMETLTVPFPMIDTTSNASNIYGGVTAYWTEEAASLTDSSPTFGRVKLEAKKLTAYSEIPNELFADSIISLQMFINEIFPEAIAWFEDIAFIDGSGVGEPLGFQNGSAVVSVTKETGQAAATIVWENIVKMYSRMLPSSLNSAVWLAHIDTFPELATMSLSVGTGGSAIWLNNGVGGPPMTILGRPVMFTEKAETLGTAGDIQFVDFSYYLIGDRQAIQADTSPHYRFQNDQSTIRFIERVDGRPWIQSAITPQTGSNTLSPFVQLQTRS
jgi:HK97 family phage major capsid protein